MAKKSITSFIYASTVTALVFCLTVTRAAAAVTSELIFSAPWGDEEGQMGLINVPDYERCGPLSFSTDGQSVFILDTVHQQIMGIDATGKAKVIAKNVAGWAICADGSGGAFVQDEKRIMHFDGNGTLKSHFGIEEKEGAPVKMVQGYGMDMFLDSGGYLCVRELDQNVHRVSGAPRMSTFSSESSTDSAESLRYKIKRLAGNEVRIIGLDPYGKVLVSVPIRLDSGQPGAVLFKGIDAQGNLYVELENLKRNNVELEAHRYSQSGERLGVLHLPNDYFTTVYKKTELARDGSVYQMLTTPEGVKILRWKF